MRLKLPVAPGAIVFMRLLHGRAVRIDRRQMARATVWVSDAGDKRQSRVPCARSLAGGTMTRTRLSAAEARRLVLAAQGFVHARPATADWRALRRMVARLGLLQIDSVNVLVRAHYLPLFSRLGAYDRAEFDARRYRRGPGRLFEYWAHEASLLPVELQPLLRWRMARARRLEGIYGRIAAFARE